ncbi:ribokinase [Saitoella complicata NRRL Y-17804]|nr:ribokinase [Saitoella complicata NRRL Y-17804]ODQ50672.1 ribokinase [Saitoella complicata NRRL Y-17804]
MPEQKQITILGSLNMDLVMLTPRVPSAGETLAGTDFHTGPGGKGANQAVATARLAGPDVKVNMIGRVGGDAFGGELVNALKKDGVDTNAVSVDQNTTSGVALILVEESSGQNRIILNPAANFTLTPDLLSKHYDVISRSSLLLTQLETPMETILDGLRYAHENGLTTVLNPAPAPAKGAIPREAFAWIDYLVPNETEAALLTGRSEISTVEEAKEAAKKLLEYGVRKAVIVTLGHQGALILTREDPESAIHVPALKLGPGEVVDTTAAGDCFLGGVAVKLAEGATLKEAIEYGVRASGKSVQKRGAMSSLPKRDEVDGSQRRGSLTIQEPLKRTHSTSMLLTPTSHLPSTLLPPFYSRPPSPLGISRTPTPDPTNTLPSDTLARTTPLTSQAPRPSTEYYGFVLYLLSSLSLLLWLLWSFTPSPWLEGIGITYFPDRWWALALPSWAVVGVGWVYVALYGWNTRVPGMESAGWVVDGYGIVGASGSASPGGGGGGTAGKDRDAVVDLPVGEICEILYGNGRGDDDIDDRIGDE